MSRYSSLCYFSPCQSILNLAARLIYPINVFQFLNSSWLTVYSEIKSKILNLYSGQICFGYHLFFNCSNLHCHHHTEMKAILFSPESNLFDVIHNQGPRVKITIHLSPLFYNTLINGHMQCIRFIILG